MSQIKLSPSASGTGIFTIESPSSNTNRTISLPDNTGTVITTGSTFAGTGPAFSAVFSSGSQSISINTATKIQFPTEEFDTASCYDNSTNYRFTPTTAGYYQVSTAVQFGGSVTSFTSVTLSIYKNGSGFKRMYVGSTSYGQAPALSALIYLNGSTDYVEVYGTVSGSSGSPAINAGAEVTYFQAALVRAA
jgi:hypothetical protein